MATIVLVAGFGQEIFQIFLGQDPSLLDIRLYYQTPKVKNCFRPTFKNVGRCCCNTMMEIYIK